MKKKAKKIGIQALGVGFLIVGTAGLVLPFLNGIILILAGLLLLSIYSPTAKAFLHKLGKQHPKAERAVQKMENWLLQKIGDID